MCEVEREDGAAGRWTALVCVFDEGRTSCTLAESRMQHFGGVLVLIEDIQRLYCAHVLRGCTQNRGQPSRLEVGGARAVNDGLTGEGGCSAPAFSLPTCSRHSSSNAQKTVPRDDDNNKQPAAMAKDFLVGPPPAPTFKEAVKADKAEYDDCTPCRVLGKSLPILNCPTRVSTYRLRLPLRCLYTR